MSNNNKQQRYLEISRQITEQVGGKENIVAARTAQRGCASC